MPSVVSLTHFILQILDKTQTEVFPFSEFLVKSLINKNYDNSRTSTEELQEELRVNGNSNYAVFLL